MIEYDVQDRCQGISTERRLKGFFFEEKEHLDIGLRAEDVEMRWVLEDLKAKINHETVSASTIFTKRFQQQRFRD